MRTSKPTTISDVETLENVHIICCACSGFVQFPSYERNEFFSGYRKGALIFGSVGLCLNAVLLIVT